MEDTTGSGGCRLQPTTGRTRGAPRLPTGIPRTLFAYFAWFAVCKHFAWFAVPFGWWAGGFRITLGPAMVASCPKCQRPIPTEDLNVSTDVALCRACEAVHKLSALLEAGEMTTAVDITRPPQGAWFRRQGLTVVAGATTRSLGAAAGLLFFCVFWNGIVSIFVGLASVSTLKLLGWTLPEWIGNPKMNGSEMNWGITLGLWLFLTPFIAIGLGVAGGVLMSLVGRTEVTLQGGDSSVFTGIGPLGRRRRFDSRQVRSCRIEENWQNSKGGTRQTREAVLQLQDGKRVKFGSGLTEERLHFVAGALRRELKV
jgi:hypothetical protein